MHGRRIARLLHNARARPRPGRARSARSAGGSSGARGEGSGEVGYSDASLFADGSHCRCDFYGDVSICMDWGGVEMDDLLAMSSAEHFPGTQAVMLFVMESFPVVHWQVVSVRLQPEAGTAEAKHDNCSRWCQLESGLVWGRASVEPRRCFMHAEGRWMGNSRRRWGYLQSSGRWRKRGRPRGQWQRRSAYCWLVALLDKYPLNEKRWCCNSSKKVPRG